MNRAPRGPGDVNLGPLGPGPKLTSPGSSGYLFHFIVESRTEVRYNIRNDDDVRKTKREIFKMKFIHIADVHLGAVPDAGTAWSDLRSRELWTGFEALLDTACDQKVDFVLIAGDLFHRQPMMKELKELNYMCERIKPVRVVIMAGNHDYLKADSHYLRMDWAENVYFFKQSKPECFYFEDKDTYIYGLSYTDFEVTEPLYDRLLPVKADGCHILLAHGGDAKHSPMKYDRIAAAGFDYAALGHIHKPELMYDGKVAYSGALQPIDRNDFGAHGYILGEWKEGSLSVALVPFSKRSYIPVEICLDGAMPWSMILDLIRAQISALGDENIYRVKLVGFRDPDIEICEDDILRLGHVIEVEDDSRPDYDFDEICMQNKNNIIGMFIERIRSIPAEETSKEKALYYGLKALFSTMER